MTTDTARPTARRTLVRGAAWSVPVMAVSAPAAHAGVSQCSVVGSVQVGPKEYQDTRAVCTAQSQWLTPSTVRSPYGRVYAPRYLEICNCTDTNQWYRWRETDTLSNFQIEVDGAHVDQNSSEAGWRSPFQLPKFGDVGGCKRFVLTYRSSAPRPYATNTSTLPAGTARNDFDITFVLQQSSSSTGPWTPVTTLTVTGNSTWRTSRPEVDYSSCASQPATTTTTSARTAEDIGTQSVGTGD